MVDLYGGGWWPKGGCVGGVGCLTQCLWLVVLGSGSDVGLADGGGSRRRRVALSGGQWWY